jgi:hypothetical protein
MFTSKINESVLQQTFFVQLGEPKKTRGTLRTSSRSPHQLAPEDKGGGSSFISADKKYVQK